METTKTIGQTADPSKQVKYITYQKPNLLTVQKNFMKNISKRT